MANIRNHPQYKFMAQNAGRQLGDDHLKETNYQLSPTQASYPFEGNLLREISPEEEFSYMLALNTGVAYFAETTQDLSEEIRDLKNPISINRGSLELTYRPTKNNRFVPMFQNGTITDSTGKEIQVEGLVGILLKEKKELVPKKHAVMKATPKKVYQGVH